MEPRIQYAKTEDGVDIAFWTMGEGEPPLVYMGGTPFTHTNAEWQTQRVVFTSILPKRGSSFGLICGVPAFRQAAVTSLWTTRCSMWTL